MIPYARELELEWQRAQQKMHDESLAGPYRHENYMYQKGYVDAIVWVMEKAKSWQTSTN